MEYFDSDRLLQTKKKLFYIFVAITVIFSMIYFSLNGYQTSDIIFKIRLVSLFIAIISLFIMFIVVHDVYLNRFPLWCMGYVVFIGYLTMFNNEIFSFADNKMTGNIIFIILLLSFTILHLWISKKSFGKVVHTLNILFLSTSSLVMLSIIFSSYYIEVFKVVYHSDSTSGFSEILSYCKISMRYYFDFPPDEYLDVFTFFQFIIGKVYEAVLIGGFASLVMKTVVSSDED